MYKYYTKYKEVHTQCSRGKEESLLDEPVFYTAKNHGEISKIVLK